MPAEQGDVIHASEPKPHMSPIDVPSEPYPIPSSPSNLRRSGRTYAAIFGLYARGY